MTSRTSVVAIDSVIADSRCQSRTGISLGLVHEYADAIMDGAELPPLSTVQDRENFYLYDGFHRLEAYRQAGKKHVVVEAEPGDVWDAIERSCAVNAIHGKRRTNEDKHRAVATMLKVMQHRGENWSNREIARRCAVSAAFVDSIVSANDRQIDKPTTVTRNGKTYEMNTSKIGKRTPSHEIDPGPENVDQETGEIYDRITPYEDPGPPPFEEVDPTDPASFLPPPRPISDARRPLDPVKRADPVPTATAVEFNEYGPDYDAMTFRSLSLSLDATFGDGFAERFARWVRTKAA